MHPAYRKKNDKVNSYTERLQGCFQFSMNGKALKPTRWPVIAALTAYSIGLQPAHRPGKNCQAAPIISAGAKGGFDLARRSLRGTVRGMPRQEWRGQKAGELRAPPHCGGRLIQLGRWYAPDQHRRSVHPKENMPLGKGGNCPMKTPGM